jgi:hypothetical protein
MDDLDVIRLVAMDNISRERIARGGEESEAKVLELGGGLGRKPPPDPPTGFPPVLEVSF